LVALLLMASAPPPSSPAPRTIFSCAVGGGRIARVTVRGRLLTYHYGRPGRDELRIVGGPGSGNVYWMTQRYTGEESQLRFTQGAFSYILYSMGGNSMTDAQPVSGLVVQRGPTRRLLDRSCARHAVFGEGYDFDSLARDSEDFTAM
jgi:hypothetical protein